MYTTDRLNRERAASGKTAVIIDTVGYDAIIKSVGKFGIVLANDVWIPWHNVASIS